MMWRKLETKVWETLQRQRGMIFLVILLGKISHANQLNLKNGFKERPVSWVHCKYSTWVSASFLSDRSQSKSTPSGASVWIWIFLQQFTLLKSLIILTYKTKVIKNFIQDIVTTRNSWTEAQERKNLLFKIIKETMVLALQKNVIATVLQQCDIRLKAGSHWLTYILFP